MSIGFTPVYKIVKDGNDITNRFNDRTTEIQIDLKGGNGDSDQCRITVDDRDWMIKSVGKGAKLEVFLGYKEVGLAQMGIFEIDTDEYEINPRLIRLVGNSIGFAGALKAPAIKNFEDKTLGQIVEEIAATGKVSAYISPELAAQKIPMLNQTASPLHVLGELERRFGAMAKFENGKLIFISRDTGEGASGVSTPALVLKPEHIQKGFVRHTQRGDYAGAKVGWFDPATHVKKYVEEKGDDATSDDERPTFLSGRLGRTEGEAKAMARSQMAALKRSMGEAHLTLSKGNPWIRDQARVIVAGFRDKIDGSYIIDTVTHSYVKETGITTEILAKPPGTGDDFTSLNEGDFYKLGTAGVVGDRGPELPTGQVGKVQDDDTIVITTPPPRTPVEIEPPLNT
ncbi:hypothetical protein ASF24_08245 [Methylobacterium sp. Leaf86]|uniref:phage late control D family protein n=1 Tax=Methylobacterium sp. Leaf86 TaxID=1736242 RepID=UPI0006FA78A2|nr:hypothetical protein [Methylobacterium sp. Leaf86]KQO49159.1 hypothetical protein ASF24_08245 [Methylobacterium sp. Leaf86]